MSAKEYLKQIKRDREYIRQLRIRKKNLGIDYNAISGLDYSMDRVQSTPKNTLEEQGWKLLERMQTIDKEIEKTSVSVDKKLEQIQQVENSVFSQVLFMRYSEYKDLQQIADDLNYNYDYVRRVHGEALAALEKNITQEVTKSHKKSQNITFLNFET